jgi:SOS-response transcriptional repressor LexA
MTLSKTITPAEAETLVLIRTFISKNGYSPTIAELAKAAGIYGNAMGERISRPLIKGAITKTPRIARSIRLTLSPE